MCVSVAIVWLSSDPTPDAMPPSRSAQLHWIYARRRRRRRTECRPIAHGTLAYTQLENFASTLFQYVRMMRARAPRNTVFATEDTTTARRVCSRKRVPFDVHPMCARFRWPASVLRQTANKISQYSGWNKKINLSFSFFGASVRNPCNQVRLDTHAVDFCIAVTLWLVVRFCCCWSEVPLFCTHARTHI